MDTVPAFSEVCAPSVSGFVSLVLACAYCFFIEEKEVIFLMLGYFIVCSLLPS